MRRPGLVWGGVLGGLTVFDLWCARNAVVGDSLSECTRSALRTHTTVGRALFVGCWAALTAWLVPHICRQLADHKEA
jgi:hypothetical protein